MSTKKINIIFNDNNYSLLFTSPYQTSFLSEPEHNSYSKDEEERKMLEKYNENFIFKGPPVHIDIVMSRFPIS
jgi:hypothetical protein